MDSKVECYWREEIKREKKKNTENALLCAYTKAGMKEEREHYVYFFFLSTEGKKSTRQK